MTTRQTSIDEDDFQAFVDGQLVPERRRVVMAYLAGLPDESSRMGDYRTINEGLRQLYEECCAHDPQGVPLLEAYLDRRFSGWRENAQGDRDTRTRTQAHSGVMTKEEAYQILGLQPGASLDEVRKAHRTLMKKLHPDQGGTAYLAARVNEAREVLLGRHR